MQWVFENGGVMPSPIPLANKKTKILASKLRSHSHQLNDVWTETLVLLTDDGARVNVKDDQAHRIVLLGDVLRRAHRPQAAPRELQLDPALPRPDLRGPLRLAPRQEGLEDRPLRRDREDQPDREQGRLHSDPPLHQDAPQDDPQGLQLRRLRDPGREGPPDRGDLPRPERRAPPRRPPQHCPHGRHLRLGGQQVRPPDRVHRGRPAARDAPRQGGGPADQVGREGPDHPHGRERTPPLPQAGDHPPRRAPAQRRHRPLGRGQAGQLRPRAHQELAPRQGPRGLEEAPRPPLRGARGLEEPPRRGRGERRLLARGRLLRADHLAAPLRGRGGGDQGRQGAARPRQAHLRARHAGQRGLHGLARGRGRGHREDVRARPRQALPLHGRGQRGAWPSWAESARPVGSNVRPCTTSSPGSPSSTRSSGSSSSSRSCSCGSPASRSATPRPSAADASSTGSRSGSPTPSSTWAATT